MIFDVSTFILVKVCLAVVILVMWLFIPLVAFMMADDDEGFVKSTPGRIVLAILTVIVFIPYIGWIWPFGVGPKTFGQHPSAAMHQTLFESYAEYKERNKPEPPPPTRTDLGLKMKRFELVSWNPPKHFYVTLEDVETQQVYKQVYVSKHCNNSGSLKAGEEYNIQVMEYTMSDNPTVVRFEFQNLYATFC